VPVADLELCSPEAVVETDMRMVYWNCDKKFDKYRKMPQYKKLDLIVWSAGKLYKDLAY
jgi:hypothetical protein